MKKSRLYLAAGIISLVLYLSGILTGAYIQGSGEKSAEQKAKDIQRQVENVQLEYTYLNTMGKELSCEFLKVLESRTAQNLWKIRDELVSFEGKENIPQSIKELERDYFLLNVKAWLLNTFVNDKCGQEGVTILYFYSIPCSECAEQGRVLDELREEILKSKMRVFVLNANMDEEIINILKDTYKVNQTPALIIGNSTYTGFTSKDELMRILLNFNV